MTNAEAILRLKDHFARHNDSRPTPYLDEAADKAYKALEILDLINNWINTEETIIIADLIRKYGIDEIVNACEKQILRADAEELDCKNCIWNDYPVYFKKKCVPCELLKCDCFSKTMYEEWED